MIAGVAAGHPATAEVGLRTLAAGGSAADAAVAAMLAACVAETVLTGLGGGGFATYYNASTAAVTCLDFFCAVPGLDDDVKADDMVPIDVSFGEVPLRYLIGGASVAVPGVAAGAGEVHRRWGRLPWQRVVEPAITLATSGVLLPATHARTLQAVAAAMLPGDGAGIYAPGGQLLQGGDRLHHPGLDEALTVLAERGPAAYYRGEIGARAVAVVRDSGGVLGPADLAAYRVLEPPVASAALDGTTVHGRDDLNGTLATIAALPELAGLSVGDRAVAMTAALVAHGRESLGDTTNISVVDADGNACVITLTLGLGAGLWLPGLGIHLNSMLGEGELAAPDARPGQRVGSMMCPLVVLDRDRRLVMAIGSAGASRIRTALLATLVGSLVENRPLADAIDAARLHPVASGPDGPTIVHIEPGGPPDQVDALTAAGYVVNRWSARADYFGAVSAVRVQGEHAAAGDPRRDGVGVLLG
jgi:gamma-glutamyltranspeptidase/glutathione hydrolase